jgi:16S rRNA (cytidine1402-2'-O)-methyltransferase
MAECNRQQAGVLLVVATPIGNLGDISARALEAFRSADLIAAEDTRHIARLLTHFGIRKPLESFHGDSAEGKLQRLVRQLLAGETITYVSDAGTPTISDPGAALVRQAAQAGITISPIPGPSAVTTALSASGLNADRFLFLGYPPRKTGERAEFAATVVAQPWTVVIYEAPSRVTATLAALAAAAPDRTAVVAREMTKRFEQFLRGSLAELAGQVAAEQPRGEFVIIVEAQAPTGTSQPDHTTVLAGAGKLLQAGLSAKSAADILSTLTGLTRNAAYEAVLQAARTRDATSTDAEGG